MTLGDRVVVMKDGLIQQIGPPLEVYRHPSNRFVAAFIGAPAMNLLDGTVGDDGHHVRLDAGPSVATDVAMEAGDRVTVGFRPQHLEIDESGMPLTVRVCEPLGEETDVVLEAEGDATITARLRLDEVPASGSTLRLRPRPGMLHLFDAESGARLD